MEAEASRFDINASIVSWSERENTELLIDFDEDCQGQAVDWSLFEDPEVDLGDADMLLEPSEDEHDNS